MFFANPWGLLGLFAIPTIIGIHLFRRRFPPLQIAGAHLWGLETKVTDAGRRRDKLPITRSLLLELLAALLLTLALADPRLSDTDAAIHLVAVLDDSASMQATPEGKTSFREQAITELARRAALTGRDTRLTLLRTGIHPSLIGTRAMSSAEARQALAEWQPTATQHGFQATWDEALQLVGDQGRFLFLTDAPLPAETSGPQGMELLAVGEPLNNTALIAARWGSNADGTGSAFVRVANFGTLPANVTVTGSARGQTVFSQALSIPAAAEAPLEVNLPNGLGQVEISLINGSDPLAVDNRVILIEPQVRVVRVAVDLTAESPELRYVMKALDALRGWQLSDAAQADLIIGDASRQPQSQRGLWWLGIGPLNRSEAIRKQAVDFIGPYLLERQNPLLDGLSLGGVVWGGVQSTDLRLSPLISVDKTIILGRVEGTQTSAWIMNIDLARSNLVDSPDWPILIANLMEMRRDALPGLRRWNYRLGENVQLRLPVENASNQSVTLTTPQGRVRTLVPDRNDIIDIANLTDAGLYEIKTGEKSFGTFAVNFVDLAESRLQGLNSDHVVPTTEYEPTRISLDNPFSWLLVLAILAVLAAILSDWWLVDRGTQRRAELARP